MVMLNCEMEFECTQKWDEMPASIDPNVRSCSACKKEVHFCHTVEDLDRAVNKHQCVAFISSETISNDKALEELVSNINERQNESLRQDRSIRITTGIPKNSGYRAFFDLGGDD